MIAKDSVLRQLPDGLDRKQALFFDGIRHAADITSLSHSRLQQTLTAIALDTTPDADPIQLYTLAFLDAWAFVDAVDRFRSLWKLLPIKGRSQPPRGQQTFAEASRSIRNLRNVADHLAERADYVIARKGAALGVLSWFTMTDPERHEGLSCAIIPGTLQRNVAHVVNPAGRMLHLPSGLIHLHAGEHFACLSDILPEMERRIRGLERGLDEEFREKGVRDKHAGVDVLIRAEVQFIPPIPGDT